jgi:hypothetical protein
VQVVNALTDYLVFEVLPRPMTDPITGINGLGTPFSLGAEVRAPGFSPSSRTLGQRLAVAIRAF